MTDPDAIKISCTSTISRPGRTSRPQPAIRRPSRVSKPPDWIARPLLRRSLAAWSSPAAHGTDSRKSRALRRPTCWSPGRSGPYGTVLAAPPGYRGDYDPGAASVPRHPHAPRIEALLAAGVDLLALEDTIPTLAEAEVLVDLVHEFGPTAWLSFQCRDGSSTAAGEPVTEAFSVAAGASGHRRGRRELRLSAARARAPRGGTKRIRPAGDRLPERRRYVGCGCPAVERKRR